MTTRADAAPRNTAPGTRVVSSPKSGKPASFTPTLITVARTLEVTPSLNRLAMSAVDGMVSRDEADNSTLEAVVSTFTFSAL